MALRGKYQEIPATTIYDSIPGTTNVINISGGPGIIKDVSLVYDQNAFGGINVTTELIVDGITVYNDTTGNIIAEIKALVAMLLGLPVADIAADKQNEVIKVMKYTANDIIGFHWKMDLPFQSTVVLRHTFTNSGAGGSISFSGIARYMVEV